MNLSFGVNNFRDAVFYLYGFFARHLHLCPRTAYGANVPYLNCVRLFGIAKKTLNIEFRKFGVAERAIAHLGITFLPIIPQGVH